MTASILLGVAVVAAMGTAVAIIRRRFLVLRISGNSMAPLIADGDVVRARRVAPERIRAGDVVAIQAPGWHLELALRAPLPPTPTPIVAWEEVTPARGHREQLLVKRVVAVGGDRVPSVPGLPDADTIVAPGLVVVLGDNMAESVDSRQFGPLPVGKIQAVVNEQRLRQRSMSA